jgi:hypothetical protein
MARVSSVTATGFDLRVQEAESSDGIHGLENISWIVVEAGSWTLFDGTVIQAGLSDLGSSTRQGFIDLDFEAAFSADPAVLTQVQTDNDAAFVKTRMQGVDASGFEAALEEEAASWRSHGAETVGWIAMDKGLAGDADGSCPKRATSRPITRSRRRPSPASLTMLPEWWAEWPATMYPTPGPRVCARSLRSVSR